MRAHSTPARSSQLASLPKPATLILENVSFRYRRTLPHVFTDLCAEFTPGHITAITGPSGCGKSTLLYVCALMISPSRGRILWNGIPVSNFTDGEKAALRAQAFGFVFQDALLDSARTVLDNVCEGSLFLGESLSSARTRARSLLEDFGIIHRIDHRPGQISGGQAQRVALCRALMNDPAIIFADEPTGNLDGDSAQAVWAALRTHAEKGGVAIVATHDTALTRMSDSVLELGTRR